MAKRKGKVKKTLVLKLAKPAPKGWLVYVTRGGKVMAVPPARGRKKGKGGRKQLGSIERKKKHFYFCKARKAIWSFKPRHAA